MSHDVDDDNHQEPVKPDKIWGYQDLSVEEQRKILIGDEPNSDSNDGPGDLVDSDDEEEYVHGGELKTVYKTTTPRPGMDLVAGNVRATAATATARANHACHRCHSTIPVQDRSEGPSKSPLTSCEAKREGGDKKNFRNSGSDTQS